MLAELRDPMYRAFLTTFDIQILAATARAAGDDCCWAQDDRADGLIMKHQPKAFISAQQANPTGHALSNRVDHPVPGVRNGFDGTEFGETGDGGCCFVFSYYVMTSCCPSFLHGARVSVARECRAANARAGSGGGRSHGVVREAHVISEGQQGDPNEDASRL